MTIEEITPPFSPAGIQLTAKAIARLKDLQAAQSSPHFALRVLVDGGGCAGFQYHFSLDDQQPKADDHRYSNDGATIVIDGVSLSLIQGAEIDFVEDLLGSSFVIRNPNAASSCGCGNSFSL
jgi:iron-sulfur cluster insertion protein